MQSGTIFPHNLLGQRFALKELAPKLDLKFLLPKSTTNIMSN